ncbi:MAG: hypothetical protein QFX32_03065 [Methanolinea sp.]|nr:hypothetical protein [Methanolinea sp.]
MESFESATAVTAPGGVILATVYVDIREEEWAVALAFGRARHPTIRGPEPAFEVRYSYRPGDSAALSFLDTRRGDPVPVPGGPFSSVDDFVVWVIEKEKERLGRKGE